MELKKYTIGYANRVNKNKCLLPKRGLHKCIERKLYTPIFEGFDYSKLIGVATKLWIKGDKIMFDGYLTKKRSLKNKVFRYGMYSKNTKLKNNKNFDYKLTDYELAVIGLVDISDDSYYNAGGK